MMWRKEEIKVFNMLKPETSQTRFATRRVFNG